VRIGLISDTHGKLRPEVFDHFRGVDRILHGGDIGDLEILVALGAISPVDAVFGNTDGFAIRASVPEMVERELEGRSILLVHGHQLGAPTPERLAAAYPAADIVVFGHTHRPANANIAGRLFLNPGGAGAPRFGLRPSVAILDLGAETESFQLIEL
jgi:uncharacterized protein